MKKLVSGRLVDVPDGPAAAADTVTIGGVAYSVVPHYAHGSSRRSHGGPILNLEAADGTVAGTLTLRRSPKGWLKPVRTGAAKGMTEYNAGKLLAAFARRAEGHAP